MQQLTKLKEGEREAKKKNTFPRDQDHSAAKRQLVADVCTEQHINLKLPIATTTIAIFADLVIFRTAVPKKKKKTHKNSLSFLCTRLVYV